MKMNYIAVLDLLAISACLGAFALTLFNRSLKGTVKILVLSLMFLSITYFLFMFVGNAGISSLFEIAEDISGAVVPFGWAFLLYGLQSTMLIKALAASETRYKELIDNVPGAVYNCLCDSAWTMRFLSDRVEQLTGYPPSDFIDNNVRSFADIIHPDDSTVVWDTVLNKIEQKSPYSLEFRIIDHKGSIRWLVDRGQATYDFKGKPQFLNGALFDITERKRAEQERERVNAVLTSKNEEMESLLQVTSHDLKSPITNLDGFSIELEKSVIQLRQLDTADDLSDEVRQKKTAVIMDDITDSIRFIKSGSEKLRMLLDGLLKVSRVSRNPLKPETVDMNKLMERISKSITYQLRKNKIKLLISELPQCTGDRVMVEQVFTNLIDNAIKYTSPDRRGTISITGTVVNDKSIYCVEDNGLGIEPHNLKSIFEIFYRINSHDTAGGEGLGLTIVQRMLKLQNGDITVESEHGQGSKFYVTLPNW